MRVAVSMVGLLVGTAAVASSPPALPQGARDLISKVATPSAARDLQGIRQTMTDEFVWSFGGDDKADSAVDEWRRDERYLPALKRVLKLPCRPADYNGVPGVECPGKGGTSFRAWFVDTAAGWKFTAFVAGD
jgi:hypothetical protein